MIDSLLNSCAALFAASDPDTRLRRRTALLFVLILIAGATVRFWGLGDVGLHGDEKTMSLPTMHLVEQGSPRQPSGMFYARAVGQLYLMAASVKAFGQTEWALRLPSALCGVLLIVLAWSVGKRFLTAPWNLSLTATVAFLPFFIDDAQTARMYVFLTTCVAGFMSLVFQWERTNRLGYLVAAVLVMVIGLQFQVLAVFAAFLVFLPALWHGDRRRLWQSLAAFAVIVAAFAAIRWWTDSAYPQELAGSGPIENGPKATLVPHIGWVWLMAAAVPALAFAAVVLRKRAGSGATLLAVASLAAALIAALSLHYHVAALFTVAGLALARREGPLPLIRLSLFAAVMVVLAGAQAAYLLSHGAGTGRQIVGLMLSWPSVWPLVAIAQISPMATIFAFAGLACGVWRFAHRRPVPDHVLMVALGVWVPLLMIGCMRWDIPARYAQAQIVPLLVGAFAAAQWGSRVLGRWGAQHLTWQSDRVGSTFAALAAVVACLLVINPSRVVDTVDSGYANHPDHKGAAQFIESIHPGPHDILVAEDVLEQTYYLGRVDYWLVNKQVAAPFMHKVQGRWLDLYTNTPLIGTGEQLRELLQRPDRGAVYVIGSGEDQEDGRGLMRAFGIAAELNSAQFKIVYRGRDGLTEVWKADAPRQAAVPAAPAGARPAGDGAGQPPGVGQPNAQQAERG
jgi:hypothetical protein